MVGVVADPVLVKRHNHVDLALGPLDSLLLLAKLLNVARDELRSPLLVHTVLKLWIVDDSGCLSEAQLFAAELKFLFAGASEPLRVSIGQAEHVQLIILAKL